MDDYMREMMDLKTLVTKSLEKKGVLARIRAELRANVFAAIEEQDRGSDGEEAPFALLGSCNERAKKLHSSAPGKLLSSLVYEYLEWCELDHTAKVYLPECNLSRGLSRPELEEKLGLKLEGDAESRPLLLEILESFLKTGKPGSRSVGIASAKARTAQSSRPVNGVEDGDGAKRNIEKHGSSVWEGAGESHAPATLPSPSAIIAANTLRTANRASALGESAVLNESANPEKIVTRAPASLLGNLPPLRRSGGLTPIGTARGNPASMSSATSSDQVPSVGLRDNLATSASKREDGVRRESSSQLTADKLGSLRNAEFGRIGRDPATSPTNFGSQSKFSTSMEIGGMLDTMNLEDDTASEDNASRHSNMSNHLASSRRREHVSGEIAESRSLSASSSIRKKSSSAYFYSDSEDDVSLEVVEEGLIEDDVDGHREKLSSTK